MSEPSDKFILSISPCQGSADTPHIVNDAPVFAGKSKEAYITRIERPYPGYLVRIPHPGEKETFSHKSFCKLEGDMSALLRAAVEWRDVTYQKLYGETTPKRVFHKKQVNSSTSLPGIRKTIKVVKKKRRDGTTAMYEVPCLIAEIWLQPGKNGGRARKSRSKVYSLNKYPEEEALAMAIRWRREQEALLRMHPTP